MFKMFCCDKWPTEMTVPELQRQKPLVVDLDQIICDRVWKVYRSTLGPCQRLFLRRKNFEIEVQDNFFVFEQIDQTTTPRNVMKLRAKEKPPPAGQSTEAASHSASSTVEKGQDNNNSRDTGAPGASVVRNAQRHMDLSNTEFASLDTKFDNKSAEKQVYKFRFEKTRKSEINVSFQKGFTVKGKANFSVGIPKMEGGKFGIETQYQVTKTEGQKFEETVVMEATSDITVGPNSCYTANVELEEKILHANFTVTIRLSMPQGRAPVNIKKKSNGKIVGVYNIFELPDMFEPETTPCCKTVLENGTIAGDKIDLVVEGVMKAYLAYNHNIVLKSDELEKDKKEARSRYHQVMKEGEIEHEH